MTAKKPDQAPSSEEKRPSGADQQAASPVTHASAKFLPKEDERSDAGQPGGGQGRVDVTGIMPEGIRVDPNITEGHPGYQESGDSEIIPPERFGAGGASKEKAQEVRINEHQ